MPEQWGRFSFSALGLKVPVDPIGEPLHMTVEEQELCARLVEVGMDIVGASHSSSASIVEEPDGAARIRDAAQSNLVS